MKLNSIQRHSGFSCVFLEDNFPKVAFDQQRKESFHDIVENLDFQQKNNLEYAIESESVDTIVEETVDVLNHAIMDSVLWNHPLFHLACLKAFKDNKIDDDAFTTSQFFYNVKRLHPSSENIRTLMIFENGQLQSEAQFLLERSWSPEQNEEHFALNREQEITFYQLISQLPLIQQCFLLAPNYSTVFDQLKGPPYQSYFLFDGSSDGSTRIIPSKGMMNAFLQAKFGEDAPQIAVRFYLSSNDGLRKRIIEDARDLYLNFKEFDSVTQVDGFPCDAAFNEAEYHDFSHLVFFGYIPKEFRRKFYHIAGLIKDNQNYADVYALLVNMEHHPFLNKELSLWEAFWESIAESYRSVEEEKRQPLIENFIHVIHSDLFIPISTLKNLSEDSISKASFFNQKPLAMMVQAAQKLG